MDFLKTLSKHAQTNGSKVAIVDNDGTRETTYAELDAMSDMVAQKLRDSGVPEGSAVLVNMGRCREYIIAEIGILKAGCAFVPVLPEYPKERVDYIKQDCRAAAVIDNPDFNITILSDERSNIPGSTAFIIYTSGSTGIPKGIVWSKRGFEGLAQRPYLVEGVMDLRLATLAPFSFVASVYEWTVILYKHGLVNLLSNTIASNINKLEDYYAEHHISIGFLTPRMLAVYKNRDKDLKRIIVSSEKVSDLYSEEYEIINTYCQSEALSMTMFKIDKAYANTPIGKPHPDCELSLLDDNGNEVLQGEEGEICVIGNYATGYLNRPEETAKTFEKLPDGRTRIHTGDIGRMLPDGNFVYINRKDWMVKITGRRVDMGEVEAAMSKIAVISAAAVKDFVNSAGSTYLVGFYAGEEQGAEFIRAELSKTLPEYMIPTGFVRLEKLPLNQNGKLDRKSLTVPEDFGRAEYAAPTNELEAKICRGFEEVLKLEKVGISDDFYLLGGSSIDAMRLQNRLNIPGLTVRTIFDGRTPREIANIVNSIQTEDLLSTVLEDSRTYYPLNDTQLGMYVLSSQNAGRALFNMPQIMDFAADVDINMFRNALLKVLNNHAVFRTKIILQNGIPYFTYDDNIKPDVPVRESGYAELKEYVKSFVRPFDISSEEVLYRCELVKTEQGFTLLFDIHHIIADGVSLAVIYSELRQALEGQEPEAEIMSPLKLGLWEEKVKQTEAYKRAQDKFHSLYSKVTARTKLRENESAAGNNKSGTLVLNIADDDKAGIDNFISGNRLAENNFFLSAFAYALSKFCSEQEVVFTTVAHGRDDYRMKNTVGLFAKDLPVYAHIDSKDKVFDLLYATDRQVQENVNAGFYPSLQEISAYRIRFDIYFIYHADLISDADAINANEVVSEGDMPLYNLDKLRVNCHKAEDKYVVSFTYRKDLYKKYVISALADMYLKVLKEFTKKTYLGDVNLAAEAKLPGASAVTPLSFLDRLAEHARTDGEKIAIVDNDGTRETTYAELDSMSELVAERLRAAGVQAGSAVLVNMGRCREYIIAEIGILKAGCVFVPVLPEYPKERVDYIKQDCRAAAVIDNPDFDITLLDNEQSNLPEDAAFVIYTSGSTGRPKGIVHTRVSFDNFATRTYLIDGLPRPRCATLCPFTFIVSIAEFPLILHAGGTLDILSDRIRMDIRLLENYYADHNIIIGFIPPKLLMHYKNHDSALRRVIVGGEKITGIFSEEYEIISEYGLSEVGYVTLFTIDKSYDNTPIGTSPPGSEVVLLDENDCEVPGGEEGEICVISTAGNNAVCYLNLPEETARTFEKLPDGRIRIHTGDIARMLPDGNLVFVNRKDWMIKVNGQRVEIGEVEAALAGIGGISAAAVKDFRNRNGDMYLAGFYVGEDLSSSFIREELAKTLPEYMIPVRFIRLERLPINQNGKLDRMALDVTEDYEEETVPPQNQMQEQIFSCVKDILGTDKFGITNDLFTIGMSSIGFIGLAVALSKTFNAELNIGDFKDNPTIEKLAVLIEERINDGETDSYLYETREYYPLTKTQQGILVECLKYPGTTIYNNPGLFKLGSKIDLLRLKEALEKTIDAHPYLKTTLFLDEEGEALAKRNDDEPAVVQFVTCAELPSAEDILRAYNVLGDRLYRVNIYKTGEGSYLGMDFHHLIMDGESGYIFLQDVNRAYSGEALETEVFTGYEHALYEERLLQTDAFDKAREYYASVFTGVDTDYLPPKDREEEVPSSAELMLESDVDLGAVSSFCKKHAVSFNAFINAVFGFVLAEYNYSEESVFATIYNGRNSSQLAGTVSMLAKTLPVYCKTEGESTVSAYVKSVQEQLINSMAHDIYSFADIAKEFGITSDILFVNEGDMFAGSGLAGEDVEQIPLKLNMSKAKIEISAYITENKKLVLTSTYRSDLYDEYVIKSILNTITVVAKEFAEKEYLKDVELISKTELALLDSFNATEVDYDQSKTVVDLFREQVQKTPDKTAVVYEDRSYTYREVDDISDRIAQYLISKGLQKEGIVGVLIPRCEYMAIASLGILKAGGAYMPLDPAYPAERLTFMLRDASSKYVIADESLLILIQDFEGEILFTKDIPGLPKGDDITVKPCPEDLFVVLYTSGSTGEPKGSLFQHSNILALCHFYHNHYQVDGQSASAINAGFGFDVHLSNLWPPLVYGGQTHVISDNVRFDLTALNEYFETNNITHTIITTQGAREFASGVDNHSLKALVTGGERLIPVEPPENYSLYNEYGPTECTDMLTSFCVDRLYYRVPIGKAIDNIKLYVIDGQGRRLPTGAMGELCAAGHKVARGYLNRPQLTAFCENPYTNQPGYERMYHTGDIVRYLPDGNIDYIGRRDTQVKIRGFRIELSEVEKAIREFGGIKDATVVAKDAPGGGKYLAAYVVSDEIVDTGELKAFIGFAKPAHMVPSAIMQIERIPLTPNGKVDKRNLPEILITREQEYVAPTNALETELCNAFAEVLQLEQVGIDDDFYAIGGSSILALCIITRCNHAGMSYAAVAEERTPRKIAKRLMEYNKNHTLVHTDGEEEPIVSWYNGYDENKPVIVFARGIIETYFMLERLDLLAEHFSVLYISPLQTHYERYFSNLRFGDIVSRYYQSIEELLPEGAKISGFAGFSYGGTICYHLAELYNRKTGKTPVLYLGDVHVQSREIRKKLHELATDGDVKTEDIIKQLGISPEAAGLSGEETEVYIHTARTDDLATYILAARTEELEAYILTARADDLAEYPPYQGRVVYWQAKDMPEEAKAYNVQYFSKLAENIEFIELEGSHEDICNLERYDKFYADTMRRELAGGSE